jgi:hypothetical protein
MSKMEIKISPIDAMKVRVLLRDCGDLCAKVTSRAVNQTLNGVKTDAADEIGNHVTAKKSAIKSTFKIVRSTPANLTAMVSSTGRALPLREFSVRETKTGVSVQVYRDKPRKVIRGAFFATVKSKVQIASGSSGHKGVFWRLYHKNGAGKGKMETAINRQGYFWSSKTQRFIPAAALPREYRLPIKQLYSSSVPEIFDRKEIMAAVLKKADARMHTNVEHELRYELSKL